MLHPLSSVQKTCSLLTGVVSLCAPCPQSRAADNMWLQIMRTKMEAWDQARLLEGLWGCLEWRMKGGRKGPPSLVAPLLVLLRKSGLSGLKAWATRRS